MCLIVTAVCKRMNDTNGIPDESKRLGMQGEQKVDLQWWVCKQSLVHIIIYLLLYYVPYK